MEIVATLTTQVPYPHLIPSGETHTLATVLTWPEPGLWFWGFGIAVSDDFPGGTAHLVIVDSDDPPPLWGGTGPKVSAFNAGDWHLPGAWGFDVPAGEGSAGSTVMWQAGQVKVICTVEAVGDDVQIDHFEVTAFRMIPDHTPAIVVGSGSSGTTKVHTEPQGLPPGAQMS